MENNKPTIAQLLKYADLQMAADELLSMPVSKKSS
jgi:hypothetical protein